MFHSHTLSLFLKVLSNTVVKAYALVYADHHLWNNLPKLSFYRYIISVSVHYVCSQISSCLIKLFNFPFWGSTSSLQLYFKCGKDLETMLISCSEGNYWLFLKPWNQKLERKTKGWSGRKWNFLSRGSPPFFFPKIEIHIKRYIFLYIYIILYIAYILFIISFQWSKLFDSLWYSFWLSPSCVFLVQTKMARCS